MSLIFEAAVTVYFRKYGERVKHLAKLGQFGVWFVSVRGCNPRGAIALSGEEL